MIDYVAELDKRVVEVNPYEAVNGNGKRGCVGNSNLGVTAF